MTDKQLTTSDGQIVDPPTTPEPVASLTPEQRAARLRARATRRTLGQRRPTGDDAA